MAGTSGSILFADNIDFSGGYPVSGEINLNGELLVGSTVAPNIRPYVPTGSNGLVINTGPGKLDFTLTNIPNGALQNSSITVTAGTGLSGGGGASLGGAVTLSLTTPVSGTNGGTGVNNGASTITLGGSLTTSGAFATTFTMTAGTMVTFPTSGTLATTSQLPSITATQFDVLVGGAANAIVSVGPGSAGQVLQSGGNAANPAYSTPTYPSASGTSRTILVSNGTNNVYSTETWATPGSSGNLLTSNGTNWTSAAPATNGTVTSVSGTANQVSVATGTTTPVISLVGPYTPATYTTHGVLIGEGTSSIVALAAGTAGQVLQSGGASADPVYSTATYPASSGGTGKILYDNGTNFVESTPTFPASASATSRKIIVSDGTNWTASTETWATPGTSGNYLKSDGTNWTSAAFPGGLTYLSGTLTNSQIKNLHGTPVQVIASPGAGKVIVCVGPVLAKLIYGGTNAFTAAAAQSISLVYGSATTNYLVAPAGGGIITNASIVDTKSNYCFTQQLNVIDDVAITLYENLGIFAYNAVATEIGGNAANNNTASFAFLYFVTSI